MSVLAVIDGTSVLFRAFFGGAPGTAPDGTPVGAVRATARMLMSILQNRARHAGQIGPVAIVFDAGQRTFRNDLEPLYKADRGDPPPELVPQFDLVQQACRSLGFPTFCEPGFEADDLMATLSRLGRAAGVAVDLFTVDKDIAQCVTDAAPPACQVDPWTGRTWRADDVTERLGVPPHQVVDLQALVGDRTDNLAGVKGVGAKTAAALLQHFDDLDDLYDRLDDVAAVPVRGARTLAAKLDAGRAAAFHTRQLVRLRDDVPMGLTAATLREHTRWAGPQPDADALFARLGFSDSLSLARRLAGKAPSSPPPELP